MRRSSVLVPVMALAACVAALAQTPIYNLGRPPTEKEILAWDITISPQGQGLPPGSGTAKQGAEIYAKKCAVCHGPTGAEGPQPRLIIMAVGKGARQGNVRWPFATTVWDFINRAMPPGQEGLFKADEVYALTAIILYRNGIIQESDVIDANSLPKIQMPNRNGFFPPVPQWKPHEKRPFGIYP